MILGRRVKILFAVCLLSPLLVTVGGCSKKPEQKPVEPPLQIGVSVGTLDEDMAQVVRKALQERERQENARIAWQDAKGDPERQEKQVDELIRRKVKAIIIQLADPTMGPVLAQKVMEKNIKLVAVSTLPPDTPLDGYVAPDYFRMGELQGQFVTDQLKKGGPQGVLLLKGDPDDYITRQMTAGFAAVAGPAGLGVTERSNPGWEPAGAGTATREAMLGKLGAVVAQSDELLLAALKELEGHGQEEQVVTVGAGGGKEPALAMAQGKHDAEADAMPEMVARYAYQAALDLVKTGRWEYDTKINNGNYDIPAKIVPTRLVEPANLYLLEQRWGKLSGQARGQGGQGETGGGQEQGQQSQGQGSGQSKKEGSSGGKSGSKVKIKTKEGKTVEIQIDGEIESVQIEKPEAPKGQGGPEQGQGQGT